MLYLIGGAPRCGKTTFSKKLAAKKRIPWISTDLIESIVAEYMSPDEIRKGLPTANVCTASPQESLRTEIISAKTLWPGTKRFIKALLKWRHDYVIEGVHLLPQYVHELEKLDHWDEVRVLYLIKQDQRSIVDGFKRSHVESDWLLQCIKSENDLRHAAEMVQCKSLYLKKQASRYHYPVVNTEKDFKATLQKLLKKF